MLTGLRYRLKGIHRDLAWRLGINHPTFKNARGSRILVYHGVCQADHLRYNTLFITLKNFESQLKLFKTYFQVISLEDYYSQNYDPGRFAISLSFDDGFANNYKYVLPLLEKYKLPASFFITGIREAGYDVLWNEVMAIAYRHGPNKILFRNIEYEKGHDRKYRSVTTGQQLNDLLRTTGFAEKAEMINLLGNYRQKAANDYWLQLTENEIRDLAGSSYVEVGSHGFYHNDLGKIQDDLVKDELIRSKQFLERTTGKPIKSFAFPYGSYTSEAVNFAIEAGYDRVLATEFLYREDSINPALRERLTINPFISNINQLHACITGHYR